MADKLLIRAFDVGLGDCFYCRIPKAHTQGRDFHILIDCGSLSGNDLLKRAVEALKNELPEVRGKRQVDLLVVTHEHKDHMAGFEQKIWDDFSFGAIWMTAAMDPKHPEAKKARKLHSFAANAMSRALAFNNALGPELLQVAEAMALNSDALNALRVELPKASRIDPTYVCADEDQPGEKLPLKGATITVLGPERDIDFYYLGKEGDPALRHALALVESGEMDAATAVPDPASVPMPANLDPADFRNLRARMMSTALAFADLDGKVCNNTSVVLLIEWRKKRLLFVGDAEWDNGYKEGKCNCSWNVMWNKRKKPLGGALSFLKIGHHGSVNATPWSETEEDRKGEPLQILNAILPVKSKAGAKAVVSTARGRYTPIPRTGLLAELGRRVSNTRNYDKAFSRKGLKTRDIPHFTDLEKDCFGLPQPPRTDLERMLGSKGFVDVEIEP